MSSTALTLAEMLAPVQAGLERMREELSAQLSAKLSGPGSFPEEVQAKVAYLDQFRGKELRAAMVLLAGQAVGNLDPELPRVAAVLELIHLATLVHDDVLDGADLRRNLPSVHTAWDEQTAILLGDMLYSRAFHLSTCLNSVLAARVLSMSAQRICAGEMEQAALRYSFDLPQARYEAIASAKTAELYQAACELGARYPDPPDSQPQGAALELRKFGGEVGLAFQIIDDVLDLEGEEAAVGKRVGNDVDDGKVTLPVLHVYQNADPKTQAAIRSAYQDPEIKDRLAALRAACDLNPGLQFAKQRAQVLLEQALGRAQALEPSPARETLIRIAEFILRRRR